MTKSVSDLVIDYYTLCREIDEDRALGKIIVYLINDLNNRTGINMSESKIIDRVTVYIDTWRTFCTLINQPTKKWYFFQALFIGVAPETVKRLPIEVLEQYIKDVEESV